MKAIPFKIRVIVLLILSLLNNFTTLAQDLKSAIQLSYSELFDDAEKIFKTLIEKEPKNGDNYFFLGENYLMAYMADSTSLTLAEVAKAAETIYKKGIESDPFNPINYVGLGKIHMFKNDSNSATEQFNKALAYLPSKTNRNSSVTPERQAYVYAKIAESWIVCKHKNITKALENMVLAEKAVEKIGGIKNPEIFIIYGDIYLEANDGSKAIYYYKKAEELDKNSPLAKIKIADIYVKAKSFQAAIPFFEEAQQIAPNFAPVYRELGEMYSRVKQYEKAKNYLKKYIELSNNTVSKVRYTGVLYMTEDYNEVIKTINEIFSVDSSYIVLYRLGAYSYCELNKFKEAQNFIETYFKKIKPEKILPTDYAYFGKILSKQNQDSLAIEKYKLALTLDTTGCDFLSDMAATYSSIRLKKYYEAAQLYEKKIAHCKPSAMDYYNLGKCYYSLQQYDKADTNFAIFLEKQPTSMNGLIYRARTKAGLDPDSKLGLALPYYDKVIEKARTDSVKYKTELIESYQYTGSYYVLVAKNYKKAKCYYQKIIAIDPNNESAKSILKTKELQAVTCSME